MEYIKAEQFLEQDKEVQKVFLDWWKPSIGDLYCNIYNNQQDNVLVINSCQIELFKGFTKDIKEFGCPLLTEGQLRKFIEDNTDKTMTLKINIWKYKTLVIELNLQDRKFDISFKIYGKLIDAYWKVALEIAKEM